MPLCINQSGTWRNITTQCVNDSGTWRLVVLGHVNQSGTWRLYRDCRPPGCCPFNTSCPLGSSIEGGRLVCKSSGVAWIVAFNTAEVSRTWYNRNDAVTRAQQVSGCTGWFVPTIGQLQNPGYACKTYWDSTTRIRYWSNTEATGSNACYVRFYESIFSGNSLKSDSFSIRAFRCVTY